VPVRIDGDDAGESKEYSLESDHYACWGENYLVRFQQELQY
jgi:hypothetical protein